MNEKVSRKIRIAVFGDFSSKFTKYSKLPSGTVRCVGRRPMYQEAKRRYMSRNVPQPNPIKVELPKWLKYDNKNKFGKSKI